MKNKQFEEWLWKTDENGCYRAGIITLRAFDDLPLSMQWGVYLEFFDSVDVKIQMGNFIDGIKFYFVIGEFNSELYDTRQQAQQEAIKKAFELLNK